MHYKYGNAIFKVSVCYTSMRFWSPPNPFKVTLLISSTMSSSSRLICLLERTSRRTLTEITSSSSWWRECCRLNISLHAKEEHPTFPHHPWKKQGGYYKWKKLRQSSNIKETHGNLVIWVTFKRLSGSWFDSLILVFSHEVSNIHHVVICLAQPFAYHSLAASTAGLTITKWGNNILRKVMYMKLSWLSMKERNHRCKEPIIIWKI